MPSPSISREEYKKNEQKLIKAAEWVFVVLKKGQKIYLKENYNTFYNGYYNTSATLIWRL